MEENRSNLFSKRRRVEMKSAEPRALAACSYTDGTLPDELMWLILFRCPVKSIFRFNCVSKTWDRSLSSSWFRMAYISFQEKSQVPRSLLGLFNLKIERSMLVVSVKPELRGPHEFFFLPTSTEGNCSRCLGPLSILNR